MSGAADTLLVALALTASALYAAYALGPKSWKRWLLATAASLLGRIAPPLAARAGAKAATLAAGAGGGACGGCGNCGSAGAAATAQAGGAARPGGEVKIPVSRIGRR